MASHDWKTRSLRHRLPAWLAAPDRPLPCCLALALAASPAVAGEHAHDHDKSSLRGGSVYLSEEHAFETVFSDDGVRILLWTDTQALAMVKKTKWSAVLTFTEGQSVTIPLLRCEPAEDDPAVHFCPMHEEVVQWKTGLCTHCSGMKLFVQDYRFAKVDLSKVKPGGAVAEIRLEDLDRDESAVRFRVPYAEKATPTEAESKQG
ncbi:MAG: hypothetical protein GF346_03500 [Candidatus Eisenbacteria bacterium]|nr:hypothetical protein [Candidatus Latescibacterota bacterium]MBD3301488.1 hypothetical protein [Candidatus Eisenbacteria bacterium]